MGSSSKKSPSGIKSTSWEKKLAIDIKRDLINGTTGQMNSSSFRIDSAFLSVHSKKKNYSNLMGEEVNSRYQKGSYKWYHRVHEYLFFQNRLSVPKSTLKKAILQECSLKKSNLLHLFYIQPDNSKYFK